MCQKATSAVGLEDLHERVLPCSFPGIASTATRLQGGFWSYELEVSDGAEFLIRRQTPLNNTVVQHLAVIDTFGGLATG